MIVNNKIRDDAHIEKTHKSVIGLTTTWKIKLKVVKHYNVNFANIDINIVASILDVKFYEGVCKSKANLIGGKPHDEYIASKKKVCSTRILCITMHYWYTNNSRDELR